MQSMSPTRPYTFRVENIPPGTTAEELIKYFYTEDQPRIRVKSIVPAVDSYELDIQEYTATVTFQALNGSILTPRLLHEDISIDRDFYGFTPLNHPQEPIAADIIAVTGLAAHAFGSWAHSAQNMWLRDYLPRDVSNARVLIYGYPSQLHGNISRSILADHSTNMIHRLLTMRETAKVYAFFSKFTTTVLTRASKCQDRPIVFIGHSLGCLIIKKVVHPSDTCQRLAKSHIKALCDINGSVGIYSSRLPVRSIIFMGAPHKGLETTALETLVSGKATEDMIRELKSESPTLTELNDKFRYVAKDIDILTFYELSPTKTAIEVFFDYAKPWVSTDSVQMPDGTWKREGPPIMMVSVDSARQYYPREQFVPCNEDHSQIAKLKRGENGIYPSIRWAIKKALPSVGDLYSEAKGIHHDESSNLGSADEVSAMRRSLLQTTHRHSSMPSGNLTADRAPGPSRSPSEDVIEQQIRRPPQVSVEQFAHHGDTQSKKNLFHETVPQRRTGIKDSGWDDTRSSANPTNSAETDMVSILLDEDIAASKSTELTTPLGAESTASNETKEETSPAPERKEVDENTALQTKDLKISTNGTKSVIMDEVMKSAIKGGDEAKTRELIAHCYDVNCRDDGGITPLLLAACYKHENILSLLLEKGANPSARCDEGNTTLHWLTSVPEIPITETLIDLLLRNRPPFEVANGQGVTPLMNACMKGESLLATRLISHGADDLATDSEGRTTLYLAAEKGQLQIAKALLDHGADIEAPEKNGCRPLHVAAWKGQLEIIKVLLDRGANIEAWNIFEKKPLHVAVMNNQLESIKMLLDCGANIEASNNKGWRPLQTAAMQDQLEIIKVLLDRGANIEASDNNGWRPLHVAAKNNQLENIKVLLDRGANIEASNKYGKRPLHTAAENSQLKSIKVLLDRSANIEASDKDGWRPLHFAIRQGQFEGIKVLLDRGANIEAPNNYGRRPLHIASKYGHLESIKVLLDCSANIKASDDYWHKPLHLAAGYGQLESIKVLLDHGANIEAPNYDGRRPLHVASEYGQLKSIKVLLDHGANIEASNYDGRRSLHVASKYGQLESIKVLLDRGANIEASNKYGSRPLHLAAMNGQLESIKLLLDRGANPTARTTQLVGSKPSGMSMIDSVSSTQKQAVRALLKEAERKWKRSH